jgi:hypothetical protein
MKEGWSQGAVHVDRHVTVRVPCDGVGKIVEERAMFEVVM